ncbi:hypothetical protein JYU34_020321 [Plutella xylostella]|uniref:Uncharacterized protein n=1 Tax=Plutella xylostella TaxID=51655 RepID=A0ABQ7PU90_PLUXY|nr:hypothetical protein JYU34_020321 [Plutella xylostella]
MKLFALVFFTLATLVFFTESVYIYSSFWAPLFNPRILNYRVDAEFDPNGGKNGREEYQRRFGYRGENLIADLGNGYGARNTYDKKAQNDVKFYYTFNQN